MSKIAVPLAEDFEDVEFSVPLGKLCGANHEVVVDRNLTTSRKPDDLDAFCAAVLKALAR